MIKWECFVKVNNVRGKTIKATFIDLVMCLVIGALQPIRVKAQVEAPPVMSLPGAAETIVSTTAASTFVTGMALAGAILVAESVSEPLNNYEVGLRKWRGSESYDIQYPNGPYPPRGSSRMLYYRYDPNTGTAFYQDVQYWYVDGFSDQWVYYDPFVFSSDNMDVAYFRAATELPGDYNLSQSFFGSVDEYYCKRNGSAWFGRPVRVHVTGYTWQPQFDDLGNLFRIITGDYSHHQWLFIPKLTFAVFTPNRVINSFLGYGYATTAYEIF